MNPEALLGKICVFYSSPDAVKRCVVQPDAVKYVGTLEKVTITNPNWVPKVDLQIRGRSGKVVTIDWVIHYAQFFDNWTEAMEEYNKPLPR